MKVLIFGNPLIKGDSLPIRLVSRLRKEFPKIEFKEFDPSEDLHEEGRELIIVDAIHGIHDVRVLTDTAKIKTQKIYSLHDFDLGLTLKLLKKMKMIDSVTIIGVPMHGKENEIFSQVKTALNIVKASLPSKSVKRS